MIIFFLFNWYSKFFYQHQYIELHCINLKITDPNLLECYYI